MNKDKTIEKRAGFTQGPWTSEDCTPGESTGLCYAIKSEHTIVARTTDGWKEARANARLIENSPAMYEQCKFLERMLASGDLSATHDGLTNCNMLAQVRELLAKVDGRDEG